MVPQSLIDQRLIVAAARRVNLITEPSKNIIVDANRYSCFSRRRLKNGSPLSMAEVVFFFHRFAEYLIRSRRVAFLAHMILRPSSRQV